MTDTVPQAAAVMIREATVDELLGQGQELFRRHWEEIARHRDVMVLHPDEGKYRALDALGHLLILAAYRGDELVGYSVSFVMTHLHYAAMVYCQNDILFVVPEARASRVGVELIRETERRAKDAGAELVFWHAKEGSVLARMLSRRYTVQDITYSKRL